MVIADPPVCRDVMFFGVCSVEKLLKFYKKQNTTIISAIQWSYSRFVVYPTRFLQPLVFRAVSCMNMLRVEN